MAARLAEQLTGNFNDIQLSLGIAGGRGTFEAFSRLCRQGRNLASSHIFDILSRKVIAMLAVNLYD